MLDPIRTGFGHRQGWGPYGKLRGMSAPDVAALLAELERSHPDFADEARTAVEWLTGGEPLETVTQLQTIWRRADRKPSLLQ